MLGGLTGLLGEATSLLRSVEGGAKDVAESLSPGATHGATLTGNLIGNDGVTDDLITGLETGDVNGAVAGAYSDIIGPGGVVYNLGQGGAWGSSPYSARALRGLALGRKSWLFAGSERGADRAAVMYTLIGTAKLNDVNPQAWLADVLARIADTPQNQLANLLPWHWWRLRGTTPKAA